MSCVAGRSRGKTHNELVVVHENSDVPLLLQIMLVTAALYVMPAFTMLNDEESVVTLKNVVRKREQSQTSEAALRARMDVLDDARRAAPEREQICGSYHRLMLQMVHGD